jgi:hypothetical protein
MKVQLIESVECNENTAWRELRAVIAYIRKRSINNLNCFMKWQKLKLKIALWKTMERAE